MPITTTHIRLGQIYREHGVKGQCTFYSYSGTADHLALKRTYILESVTGEQLKTRIKKIAAYRKMFLVHFDLFASPEEIKPWRKATLWLEKKKLQRADQDMFDYEWEGFSLLDHNKKRVGGITGIVYTPLKQFVVKRSDETEVFVPFVVEWLVKLEREKKKVTMRLPEGLI
jgi:16S rRNA processing protein RimM